MTKSQPQGFLALPPAGKGPGVLVLHAWWGLNDTIKAFCTRLAESGFAVFAPDLYHGKVADNIADAETSARLSTATSSRPGLRSRMQPITSKKVLSSPAVELRWLDSPWECIMRWTWPPPIPNASIPSSSFTGPGTATTAAPEQPTWVTSPRMMSSSRNPTSTPWKHPSGVPAAR